MSKQSVNFYSSLSEGLSAEELIRKAYNASPSEDSKTHDMILPDGRRAELKTTRHKITNLNPAYSSPLYAHELDGVRKAAHDGIPVFMFYFEHYELCVWFNASELAAFVDANLDRYPLYENYPTEGRGGRTWTGTHQRIPLRDVMHLVTNMHSISADGAALEPEGL